MTSLSLTYRRDLLAVLISKEFKVRYKNTFLGYAWSVLNPLAFAVIFWIVFRVIMRFNEQDYFLFLITGQFPWQFLANSVSASNGFFLSNATLIKKVKFPRYFLVMAGVGNDAIHFLATVPVILIIILVRYPHALPTWHWLWGLPVLLAIQLMLVTGLALLVASINVFFRDLERLVVIALSMWFYATPVIYPVSLIPERFRWTLYANPMSPLMGCWRELFIRGFRDPTAGVPWGFLGVASAWALALLLAGMLVYNRVERRFAEVV